MHLLCLNPVGSVGGAERVLLQLLQGVSRLRPDWRLTLLTMTDGPLLEAASRFGVRPVCLPMPDALAGVGDSHYRGQGKLALVAGLLRTSVGTLPALSGYLRKFRETVRRLAPDLVHSNGIKSHLLGRVGVPAGVPVTWHLHDYFSLRSIGKLLRRASGGVRGAIAISKSVADDAAKVLPKVPTRVVLNSVDTEQFSPASEDGSILDRLAGLPVPSESILRVGLVATYALWKGHRLFLEAAAELIRTYPHDPVRFYVVGGGIYHTKAQWSRLELEALAESLGIRERVGFVPFQANPAPVYRALDVVVHASTQPEPFGLTIAEAMACGRSAVVSRAGGAAELFDEGVDALGFTPENRDDLVRTLVKLVTDPNLRERLGSAARETATAKFSPERFCQEAVDFFTSIIRSNTR